VVDSNRESKSVSRSRSNSATAIVSALVCVVALSACASSNPCSNRRVVQVTEDHSPGADQMRAKMLPTGLIGGREDVELDDGHVYAANFFYSIDAATATQTGNMPPGTGDEIELCVMASSDGSKHYAFPSYKGSHYEAELLK